METKKAILFGNGFNYLFDGKLDSWESLVGGKGNKITNDQIPFTLQYEVNIMRNDVELNQANEQNKEGLAQSIITSVKNIIESKHKTLDIYKAILEKNFDNYLTTNYDNLLYHYIIENKLANELSSNKTETTYNIRRYYEFEREDHKFRLWNIHGDVDNVVSMMIGYNHYCGSIGKIYDYLKGGYKYKVNEDNIQKFDSIEQRILDGSIHNNANCSWIDKFFTDDIHIIGLGLNFTEVDIWWILDYRCRLKHDSRYNQQINNNIFYYCNQIDCHKRKALEGLDVKIIKADSINNVNGSTNYLEIYKKLISKMQV